MPDDRSDRRTEWLVIDEDHGNLVIASWPTREDCERFVVSFWGDRDANARLSIAELPAELQR